MLDGQLLFAFILVAVLLLAAFAPGLWADLRRAVASIRAGAQPDLDDVWFGPMGTRVTNPPPSTIATLRAAGWFRATERVRPGYLGLADIEAEASEDARRHLRGDALPGQIMEASPADVDRALARWRRFGGSAAATTPPPGHRNFGIPAREGRHPGGVAAHILGDH